MGLLYSPLLLITAWLETRQAAKIKRNRRHGESDEDTVQEWEQMAGELDFEAEGWAEKVESSRPNVETGAAVLEVLELRAQVQELCKLVEVLGKGDMADGDGR